jgi:NADH-quinone oxidoreductase subunit A
MSIMIILSIIISIAIILGTFYLNKFTTTSTVEKLSQYECGFEPIEEKPGIETRERYYIKFHIVAVIFLIFDLEAILLYPFTTILYNNIQSGGFGLLLPISVFFIFMFFLILGLFYEFKKGVLS